MILHHGTSTVVLSDIRAKGLTRPYLTDDPQIAAYYAGCVVDEMGGEAVVLDLEVDESVLLPDVNAIDEPVMRDEDEVWARFEEIPDDWRTQPDAWKVTMDLVSSVRSSVDLFI